MKYTKYLYLLIFVLCAVVSSFGQNQVRSTRIIYGKVIDNEGKPLDLVSVFVKNSPRGTTTDSNGNFELKPDGRDSLVVTFSRIGCITKDVLVSHNSGKTELIVTLQYSATVMQEVSVKEQRHADYNLSRLDSKLARIVPDASGGGVEALVMTQPGVSTNSELSSQYMVRGGNFDENLVYVNDVEIHRPFLVRTGQQEGLSFVNPWMVQSVGFSAGGFDAKYGDKMSSVLDIRYRKPTRFGGNISAGLLGGNINIETVADSNRFTMLHSLRYKSNSYLLGTLDTKGEYNPSFVDYQTYMTYKINETSSFEFLGNFSRNRYEFVPQSRETKFGTFNTALALKVYFDGWENDLFQTSTAALTYNYRPNGNKLYKIIGGIFNTVETENYDILGEYWINQLDNNQGSSTLGDSIQNIGVGGYMQHARNQLNATVTFAEFKAAENFKNHALLWGLKLQREMIHDRISAWELRDSAGYSLPYDGMKTNLYDVSRATADYTAYTFSGYVQSNFRSVFNVKGLSCSMGVRLNYWSFNQQGIVSPRINLFYEPGTSRQWVYRMAMGVYQQPPFYKEIRNSKGDLNENILAQRSYQILGGIDRYFIQWGRPFKFTVESYYKQMDRLIPYDVDNVQIKYYGKNLSKGFSTGIDMRLYGEFVPGIDSWLSLSVMRTMEDLYNDQVTLYDEKNNVTGTLYPGFLPRPTDQRVNFSMFFQDYLPGKPQYRVHLRTIFGTGLPFGPPNGEKYLMKFRMPPYQRVDLGFSRQIASKTPAWYKNIWLECEIFNLFDINNVNSYFWINDIYGHMFAIPNYLTGRRLNIKVSIDF